MKKLTKEQIDKAVNWWSNIIQNPKFDNGDTSTAGATGFMLATLARDQCKPTEAQINDFKKHLKNILENAEELPYRGLFCDYHPEAPLSEAAEKSGISEMNFPWKTRMWFRDEKVIVSCGYKADLVEL